MIAPEPCLRKNPSRFHLRVTAEGSTMAVFAGALAIASRGTLRFDRLLFFGQLRQYLVSSADTDVP